MHKADTAKAVALAYKTFSTPNQAIPTPLIAGPNSIPNVAVLCMMAFAAVSSFRPTSKGIAAFKVGPKAIPAMAMTNTKT